jgi:hypothetical protein
VHLGTDQQTASIGHNVRWTPFVRQPEPLLKV